MMGQRLSRQARRAEEARPNVGTLQLSMSHPTLQRTKTRLQHQRLCQHLRVAPKLIRRCTRSRWMQRRSRNLAQTDSRSMSRRRSETARSLRLMRARQNHLVMMKQLAGTRTMLSSQRSQLSGPQETASSDSTGSWAQDPTRQSSWALTKTLAMRWLGTLSSSKICKSVSGGESHPKSVCSSLSSIRGLLLSSMLGSTSSKSRCAS
mmetsp:Transcript_3430/g.8545  ORF Transcript_3430/g.8545 Transcript_3430/m.8545 type:complete len:206 (+) Transcript_3430:347-964(+)